MMKVVLLASLSLVTWLVGTFDNEVAPALDARSTVFRAVAEVAQESQAGSPARNDGICDLLARDFESFAAHARYFRLPSAGGLDQVAMLTTCSNECSYMCTYQCTWPCSFWCTYFCTGSCTNHCTYPCTGECTYPCTFECTDSC